MSSHPVVCQHSRIVKCSLSSPHDDVSLKVLVSLPPTYPASSPPQLQLLSRYIGAFGADSNLFGSILRTFISINGIEWSEDTVCVFDGLQNVLERCTLWYEERLGAEKAGELVRDDMKEHSRHFDNQHTSNAPGMDSVDQNVVEDHISGVHDNVPSVLPAGVNIYTAEPITDRKSAFVGRACRIEHPSEVRGYSKTYEPATYRFVSTGSFDFVSFNVRSTNISSCTSHYQRLAVSSRRCPASRSART